MSLETLLNRLTAPDALRWLPIALPILFALFVARFAWRQHRLTRAMKPPVAGPHRLLMQLLTLCLTAIFIYQALWQLAGFHNADFMTFMSRYSRRVANPREGFHRGRILDRNGLVLAESNPKEGRPRVYPFVPAACHVIGYADPTYGTTGIERANDAFLSGRSVRDARHLRRFGQNLFRHGMVLGNDTVLTLDARLQVEAARLFDGKRGAAVAIDPRTGAIRLIASAPYFNQHRIEPAVNDASSPLLNRALDGLYPPGSTFKIFMAVAAIQSGKTGEIDCPAEGYAPGDGLPPIRDHEYYDAQRDGRRWRGHGRIDLGTALQKSSNVYFARLAPLLGANAMAGAIDCFGMEQANSLFEGSDSRIQAKGARLPTLANAPTKVLTQTAIGQGSVLVTPYQMARAVAIIAADGRPYRPFLDAETEPQRLDQALPAQTARTLKALMIRTVTQGTGRGMAAAGVSVGGKTGTAQNPSGADHGWFVCFAPAENPAIALAVIVENGGYGAQCAVPIAAALVHAAAQYGLLNPLPPAEASE